MGKRVLVTGVSGFLAQHCAAELLKQGYLVRGSVRDLSKESEVRKGISKEVETKDKLEFCKLNLTSDNGWDEAMKDCEFVLHVASPFIIKKPKHEDELLIPAKEGTLRALKAAKKAGIKRIVITSSLVAMSGHLKEGSFNTKSWTDLNADINAYSKSKTIAEKAAWDFINNQTGPNKLELSVINPGAIIGPTLTNNLSGQSMNSFAKLISGKMPMIPDLNFSIADVRDVAKMHVRAMEIKEASGKRFIVASDKPKSYQKIAEVLKANGYQKVSTQLMPTFMLKVLSYCSRDIKGILPFIGRRLECDNSQTKKLLNWEPTPFEQSVIDTAKSVEVALNTK